MAAPHQCSWPLHTSALGQLHALYPPSPLQTPPRGCRGAALCLSPWLGPAPQRLLSWDAVGVQKWSPPPGHGASSLQVAALEELEAAPQGLGVLGALTLACPAAPNAPQLAPASQGYSHVGLGGVGQGDAEVGDVLEDTKGRGEIGRCGQGVTQGLLLSPGLPAGLRSPSAASPCWEGRERRGPRAARGSGWETRRGWRAGNWFPLAIKARLYHETASFPCWGQGCPAPVGPLPGDSGAGVSQGEG